MRLVFFCLLLLNVLFAVMSAIRNDAPQASARVFSDGTQDSAQSAGSLVLADPLERTFVEPAEVASPQQEDAVVAETGGTALSLTVDEITANSVAQGALEQSGPERSVEGVRNAPESELSGDDDPGVPLAELPDTDRFESMVSESALPVAAVANETSMGRDHAAITEAPAVSGDDHGEPPLCMHIGPFVKEADASRLLANRGIDKASFALVPIEVSDKPIFWVHVPPLPSAQEAQRAQRKLARDGVESFVISDSGPLHNGVSLGVFRDPASAQRTAQARAGIGYPVAIHEAPRKRTVYFLDIRLDPPDRAMVQSLEETATGLSKEVRVETIDCAEAGPQNIAGGDEHR